MMEATVTQVPTRREKEETPLEAFASICSVLVIGLFVLTFIFQNFEIPSSSMEKTLLIGDHVMVNRIALAPASKWAPFVHYRDVRRGDVIVFYKPGEPDLYLVKRVIGIPGDRIHLRNGVVFRNGQQQDEAYAIKPDYQDYFPYRDDFPSVPAAQSGDVTPTWALDLPGHVQNGDLVVPAGEYFAMGDNRPVSLDSRYWGFVPRENIVGSPLFIYWSFIEQEDQYERQSAGERIAFYVHVVTHFFSQTRWRRTLRVVH